MARPRRTFSLQQKQQAIESYLSGDKSAAEIARDLDITTGLVYKWKAQLEQLSHDNKINNLVEQGATRAMATKIAQQQAEIEAYQKKVAELTVINDLLKKLQEPSNYQSESELSGLIETSKRSARKKPPVK